MGRGYERDKVGSREGHARLHKKFCTREVTKFNVMKKRGRTLRFAVGEKFILHVNMNHVGLVLERLGYLIIGLRIGERHVLDRLV